MTIPLNLPAVLNTLRGRVITAVLGTYDGNTSGVTGELVDLIVDEHTGELAALYLRVGTELTGAATTCRKIVPWAKVDYIHVRDGEPQVLARIADRHADGVLEIAPNIVLIWQPPPPLDDLLTDEQADQLLALLRGDDPPHQVTGGFRP